MVSWRRSPAGNAASGSGTVAPGAGTTVGSRVPQPPQNFSPASVAYARQQAAGAGLAIDYEEADLRAAGFGPDGAFDAVMQIFGELNVFEPSAARGVIGKAFAALKPGGRLLLEVAVEAAVRRMGAEPPRWWSAQEGLFGAEPHRPKHLLAPVVIPDLLEDAHVVVGVPGAPPLSLACLVEAFLAVLADGFQQPIAGLEPVFVGYHQ